MNISHFRTLLLQFRDTLASTRFHIRLFRYVSVQKLLIFAALLIVLLFDILHVYADPTSMAPVGSIGFELARAITALFLIILLVTDPPRAVIFRAMLGVSAVVIMAAAIYALFSYQLGVIDSVLYVEVAIILGLEALEPKAQPHLVKRVISRGRPLA